MPSSPRFDREPTSDELRTYLAGERTFLAWIRTAVALSGFGFLVARFGLFLREMAAVNPHFPVSSLPYSAVIGTGLVALGTLSYVVAAMQFRSFVRQFRDTRLGSFSQWGFSLSLALLLALLGLALTIALLSLSRGTT